MHARRRGDCDEEPPDDERVGPAVEGHQRPFRVHSHAAAFFVRRSPPATSAFTSSRGGERGLREPFTADADRLVELGDDCCLPRHSCPGVRRTCPTRPCRPGSTVPQTRTIAPVVWHDGDGDRVVSRIRLDEQKGPMRVNCIDSYRPCHRCLSHFVELDRFDGRRHFANLLLEDGRVLFGHLPRLVVGGVEAVWSVLALQSAAAHGVDLHGDVVARFIFPTTPLM